MKIAVLEWICGGGLANLPAQSLNHSLKTEGLAMLQCLVTGLVTAGHEIVVSLDQRIPVTEIDSLQIPQPARQVNFGAPEKSFQIHPVQLSTCFSRLLAGWQVLANQSDYTIVIAPESNGVLEKAIELLLPAETCLLNCSGNGLRMACDKLRTHDLLNQAGLANPPTCELSQLSEEWILAVQAELANTDWVIKPRDGAGCEALQFYRLDDLKVFCDLHRTSSDPSRRDRFLVQPRVGGRAMSCSAIVDAHGDWHWMPLVTQEFTETSQPQYIGGILADADTQAKLPSTILRKLEDQFGADMRGWIGIDLVWDAGRDKWVVIEINPRCTTSLVGLSAAYSGNLAAELLAAQTDNFVGLSADWKPVSFSPDGSWKFSPTAAT